MNLPKVTRVQADSIHMPEWTIKVTRRPSWEASIEQPDAQDIPKDIRDHLVAWLVGQNRRDPYLVDES